LVFLPINQYPRHATGGTNMASQNLIILSVGL
jgi:hypothetical protein